MRAEQRGLDTPEGHRHPWGLLAYRCAAYGDEPRWQRFLQRLDELLDEGWRFLDQHTCQRGSIADTVRHKLQIKWIEDATLQGQGVDEVRR